MRTAACRLLSWRSIILLVLSTALFIYSADAQAAINKQMSFYGTLQNTTGTNLNGNYDMVFRFYDAQSGGTLLDTSTHTAGNGNAVTVVNGHFAVKLGSGAGNALDGLNFNSADIYIGLTIGSDSEMAPRERMASAAYAFNTDALDGYDSLDFLRLAATNTIAFNATVPLLTVRQNGSGDILNLLSGAVNVFSVLSNGNVGIGTTSPSSKLSVAGDLRVTGALRDSSGDAGTIGQVLLSTFTGTNWVATSTLGLGGSSFTNSAQLAALLSDETGTGAAVFANSPTLSGTVIGGTFSGGTWNGGAVSAIYGGTAQTSYASGDILYASAANTLSKRAIGITGQVMQVVGGLPTWVATSSLGITGGGGSSLFTDGGATTYLTSLSDNLAIGTTSSPTRLTVAGDITLDGGSKINFGNSHYFYASTTLWSYAIGQEAGLNNTGYDNFFVGDSAGFNNTGSENIAIGFQTGYNNSGSYSTLLGQKAGYANSNDLNNIIGFEAGYSNTGVQNEILGYRAGQNNSGPINILIGTYAGDTNSGSVNTIVGGYAGTNNSGNLNTFLGAYSGDNNSGDENIGIGDSAGGINSGNQNIFMGIAAGELNKGLRNNFIGYAAGHVNQGEYNNFFGYKTGYQITATNTVAIGTEAMYGPGGGIIQVANSVVLGYRAGYGVQSGSDNNIFLGAFAGNNVTTGDNNVIIGYNIDNITATVSNRLNIGNLLFGTGLDGTGTTLSSGNIGIGTSTPVKKLQVYGDIRVGKTGTNGCLENYGGGVIGGTCSSDERLKTDIQEFSTSSGSYLAGIVSLKPINYHWNTLAKNLYSKNPEIHNVGLTAQNVEAYFPELVSQNEEGYKQVDFVALPFYIIEAIKELWYHLSGLEEKVKEIDDLKRRVDALETKSNSSGSNQNTPPAGPIAPTEPNIQLPSDAPASDSSSSTVNETAPAPEPQP